MAVGFELHPSDIIRFHITIATLYLAYDFVSKFEYYRLQTKFVFIVEFFKVFFVVKLDKFDQLIPLDKTVIVFISTVKVAPHLKVIVIFVSERGLAWLEWRADVRKPLYTVDGTAAVRIDDCYLSLQLRIIRTYTIEEPPHHSNLFYIKLTVIVDVIGAKA